MKVFIKTFLLIFYYLVKYHLQFLSFWLPVWQMSNRIYVKNEKKSVKEGFMNSWHDLCILIFLSTNQSYEYNLMSTIYLFNHSKEGSELHGASLIKKHPLDTDNELALTEISVTDKHITWLVVKPKYTQPLFEFYLNHNIRRCQSFRM